MPRLSSRRYLAVHDVLYERWHEHHGNPLQYLSPAEQWALHDYFRLSEQLSDIELLDHRKRVSQQRPSLPALAGKARKKLDGPFPGPGRGGGGAGPKHIVIYPLVRPTPDVDKFVRALLLLAEQQLQDDEDSAPGLPGR
jgi:hypothetical protein